MIVPLLFAAAVLRPEPVSRSEHRTPLAEPSLDWTAVADCESGGDWQIDTGNGYYGGLQFSEQTWDGFDGLQFAARPDLATETDQIVVAERVLTVQGPQAWPTCGRYLKGAA